MTRDQAVRQFEPINEKFLELDREAERDDFSNVRYQEASHFIMLCLAYIEDTTGVTSVYARLAQELVRRWQPRDEAIVPLIFGVAQALNDNIIHGFVPGIE